MPVPKQLLKQMICCLSEDNHILCEPIMIRNCGGHACKLCINRKLVSIDSIKCFYCNKEHKRDYLLKMEVNATMKSLIEETYLKDLINELNEELKEKLEVCKGS